MIFNGVTIAFGLTGSFSTINSTTEQIKKLIHEGAIVIPIMSFNAYNIDTRFGKAKEFISEIENITKHKIINTFVEAEQIYLNKKIDIMIIAPCTGNSIGKLANGIVDTPVLMAAKTNLKNDNSLVLGISTNDGLSTNAENIGKLLNAKNIFFIPFMQNNPITKPNSLMFNLNYTTETIKKALDKKQIQPILY